MSFRSRLQNIVVGGCLIACLACGSLVHGQENNQQQKPAAAPSNQTQPKANDPLSVTVVGPVSVEREQTVEPNWAKPNCEKPGNHDEADLCQQRSMAVAAQKTVTLNYVQIGIGVLTLIGLAYTVLYTRRTANAAIATAKVADEANELNKEASEANKTAAIINRRAWLGISTGTGLQFVHNLRVGDPTYTVVAFQASNVGLTPAINVDFAAEFAPASGDMRKIIRDFAERLRTKSNLTQTIFPNHDSPSKKINIGLTPSEIKDATVQTDKGARLHVVLLYGVRYEIAGGKLPSVTANIKTVPTLDMLDVHPQGIAYGILNSGEITHSYAD